MKNISTHFLFLLSETNNRIFKDFCSSIRFFKAFLVLFFVCVSTGYSQTTEVLTSGSSWNVPCGVTSITVEVWGAGGGGGRASGDTSAGGGGSGGGYVRSSFSVIPNQIINYSIGTGGSGTDSGLKNGGDSWFISNTTLLAIGGNGALNVSSDDTFGSGATAPTTGNLGGDLISTYGGNGGNASNVGTDFSGGSGSSGGSTAAGNASGITGGAAPTNGFAGVNGRNNNGNGASGNIGAGGAGGRTSNDTNRNGGAGGSGQIRITYTVGDVPSASLAYGANVWNVYAWNGGDATGGSGAWLQEYRGYYVDSNFNFDSAVYWNANNSPDNATGYSGCTVDDDYHSWSAKREGFTCGLYNIDVVRNDDAAQLYINDVLVWSRADWSGSGATPVYNLNVWQGTLGPNDRIEFRVSDATGESQGNITFTTVAATAPNLVTSSAVVCTGSSTTLTASGSNIGTSASTLWFETATCPTTGFVHEFATLPYATYQTTVNSVNSGILTVTSDNVSPADSMIFMENIFTSAIDPAVQRYISVRYRVTSGTGIQSEFYFKKETQVLAEDKVVRGNLISDGNWHVLSVDMGSNANWNNTGGNITGWRFDYTTGANVQMEIDYIVLASSRVLENAATDDTSITVTPTVSPTSYSVLRTAESVCGTISACAATQIYINKTWTGAVDGNWTTAGNWLPSGMPTIDQCVYASSGTIIVDGNGTANSVILTGTANLTITSGNTLTVENIINTSGTSGTFLVEDSASILQDSEVVNSGDVMIVRNAFPMKRFDFTYWSSPVASQNLYDFSPFTLFNKYFSWNPSSGWMGHLNGAATMQLGKGYIIRAPQSFPTDSTDDFEGTFEGVPNNGEIAVPDFAGSDTDQIWNLIGNPYPSAIDIDLFIDDPDNTEVGGTIYVWTHNTPIFNSGSGLSVYTANDYAAYTRTGGVATAAAADANDPTDADDNNSTPVDGIIASGQSFFIRGLQEFEDLDAPLENPVTVKFKNYMRVLGNNSNFYKPSPPTPVENWEMTGKHRLWISLQNSQGAFNQALVGYVEGATDGLDRLYDGQVFGGSIVSLYSIMDQTKLTIQGKALPFNAEDVVPLGYRTTIAGNFHISLDQFDGLFSGQDIFLKDKVLNVVHDLKGGTYSFTSTIGTFDDRFEIVYTNQALGNHNPEFNTESIIVYKNSGSDIAVNAGLLIMDEVKIYDISGRLIAHKNKVNNNETLMQNLPLTQQVLIVEVVTNEGFKVARKIIF